MLFKMLLKYSELKHLYVHFSYQYGPGVTVQCLWCHCIHAAYQYDTPAPLLGILWGNTDTHTQLVSLKSSSVLHTMLIHRCAHSQIYKHPKKRQSRLILTKQCAGRKGINGHTCNVGISGYYLWELTLLIACPLILNWILILHLNPYYFNPKFVISTARGLSVTTKKNKRLSLIMLPSSVGSWELLSLLLNIHHCRWKHIWWDSGRNVQIWGNVLKCYLYIMFCHSSTSIFTQTYHLMLRIRMSLDLNTVWKSWDNVSIKTTTFLT